MRAQFPDFSRRLEAFGERPLRLDLAITRRAPFVEEPANLLRNLDLFVADRPGLVFHRPRPYFFRVALMSASMWSRYFSNARRPAALSRYSVRGVRPTNVFSHST